jgi:hypothetical protein
VAIEPGGPIEHVIVPVDDINKISVGAISLARELSSLVTAVHLSDDRAAAEEFRARWDRAVPGVPLLIIESPYRAFVAPMVALVQRLRESEPHKRISLILPTFATRHWWERLLHNRDVTRLRGALGQKDGVKLISFTYDLALQKPAP